MKYNLTSNKDLDSGGYFMGVTTGWKHGLLDGR